MSEREALTPLERELVEALRIVFRQWDARCSSENDFADWPDDAVGVLNDAWKAGFYLKARAALAKAEQKEKGNG